MKETLKKIYATFLFWVLATLATILTAVISLCVRPFVSQKVFARIFESVAGRFILWGMWVTGCWSVQVINRSTRTLHANDRFVIVANHLSFVDSLVAVLLPMEKKFIMARKFSSIPIFGSLCQAAGHVLVDKHDPSTTQPAVELAYASLQDGSSFMIYPEGQRSDSIYNLLNFKTGAFRLAAKTDLAILPITLIGTEKALALGGVAQPANIKLIVNTPIRISPLKLTKEAEWKAIKRAIKHCKEIMKSNIEHYTRDQND